MLDVDSTDGSQTLCYGLWLLFVSDDEGAWEHAAAGQNSGDDDHAPDQEVDHADVDQAEDVQRSRAPVVRLVQFRLRIREVDVEGPVVAEEEPDDEEHSQREGGHPRAGAGPQQGLLVVALRSGKQVQPFIPARPDLPPDHPEHLDCAEGAADNHVHRQVRLPRAVPEVVDTCKRKTFLCSDRLRRS